MSELSELRNRKGVVIPQIGLGTYPLTGKKMADNVVEAVRMGYRLIDTADDYHNEDGIGNGCAEAIKMGLIEREDLFLQTKISDNHTYKDDPLAGIYFCEDSWYMKRHSVEDVVREKVSISLRSLKTDYIDSILIHLPYVGFFYEIWEALCKLKDEGLVRYIGVSNCRRRHFEMLDDCKYQPDIHEFFMSPICTKKDVVDLCKERNVVMMTYSPIIDLRNRTIDIKCLQQLADKYNKTAAQILLRWNVEHGSIPLPKSENKDRLKQNIETLNFTMSKDDVLLLDNMNTDHQYMAESRMCPGL